MKVLLYARVSTLGQERNDTIKTQINELTAYAKAAGYEYELYKDTASGASEKRVFALIEYLQENNFDKLVFTYADRLARDVYLQLFLLKETKKLGVELVSLKQEFIFNNTDNPFANSMLQIMAVFAELEKNMIAARLKAGKENKQRSGRRAIGRLPFGYTYEGKGKSKKLVINEKQAEIVKHIFAAYNSCKSLQRTANEVNGAHGTEFSRQAVSVILKNKIYTGVLIADGKEINGKHAAIISKNLFTRCQK